MSYETVEINVTKLSENKYRDGNKVYIVANLIERAKELEPFDLPPDCSECQFQRLAPRFLRV